MRPIFAISFAALYGLTIRLLFGFLGDIVGIMSLSCFVLVPFVVGFLTVVLWPGKRAVSGSAAFFLPWLSCLLILIITIFLNVEGVICWVMAYPFFAVVAGFGGLIANGIRKRKQVDIDDVENYEKWTKPGKLNFSLLVLLPLIAGIGEGARLQHRKDMTITKSIIIHTSTSGIMKALANTNEIKPVERHSSMSSMLGFPHHLKTLSDTLAAGGKRKAIYEKGLYFDETIARFEPGKLLVLDIKTDPAKVPPAVLDEHILIGGRHVDILQDIYSIEQLPGEGCRVNLSSHFLINTPFNWYAGIWANYLMGDILNEELELLKQRAEDRHR